MQSTYPTSHLLEIHPNIIHPSTPRSPQQSLSLRFPHQHPIRPLSSPIRATYPAHLILLNFITHTILGEEYRSLSSSLRNLLHSPVPSSLLGPNILLNTIFSNTLRFLSSLNVNDQVSHPYKTTGKIIVLCIFIFKFLDSNLEDKRFLQAGCFLWRQNNYLLGTKKSVHIITKCGYKLCCPRLIFLLRCHVLSLLSLGFFIF